jgi:hypothetical protein
MLNALPCKLGVADLEETDGGAQLLPDGVLRFGGEGS